MAANSVTTKIPPLLHISPQGIRALYNILAVQAGGPDSAVAAVAVFGISKRVPQASSTPPGIVARKPPMRWLLLAHKRLGPACGVTTPQKSGPLPILCL